MQKRSAAEATGPRRWTNIVGLSLAASLLAPIGAALAEPASAPGCEHAGQNCGQAPPLDQLALTIGQLRASLSAIRGDLDAPDQAPGARLDRLCAVPLTEVQAEWERAEAAMRGELVSLRARLAAAEAEVARLTGDHATWASHTVELDEAPEPGAGEGVGARAEPWKTSPIPSAEAAEIESVPQPAPMPRAAPPDPSTGAPPRAVAARDVPASDERLQLQAELALAQLKIAELSSALESARLHQEAMEAEVGNLRALTDAKIKELLGWR